MPEPTPEFSEGPRQTDCTTASISKSYPKDFTAVIDYIEPVSYARQIVDERAKEYFSILAKYGFPDIPIRHEVETGENRLRWNWPPLRT